MKFGVVIFPGSNCDHDTFHVLDKVLGHETSYLWHKEHDLRGVDCVVLPGGFSYGDYLRSGAIAQFSPLMQEVGEFAAKGGLVLGICNGFQVLLELGLIPGAMIRNKNLKFLCQHVHQDDVILFAAYDPRLPAPPDLFESQLLVTVYRALVKGEHPQHDVVQVE